MDEDWAIRRMAADDDLAGFFETFALLLCGDFPEYSPAVVERFLSTDYSIGSIREGIASGTHFLWVRQNRNRVIGFLLAAKPYVGVAFCNWVGVVNTWRGRGVATALLRQWEGAMRDLGAHNVHLWTAPRP